MGDNRVWLYRLAGYLSLLAMTVAVCVLAFRLTLPAPPPEFRRDRAEFSQDGTHWQPVTLPHQNADSSIPSVYRFSFDHTSADARLWSVFLPRFVSRAEVTVNRAVVFDSRESISSARPDRNIPKSRRSPALCCGRGITRSR